MLQIRYPCVIKKMKLCIIEQMKSHGQKSLDIELKCVRHLLRLPEETPVKIAYREANRINKANKINNCKT